MFIRVKGFAFLLLFALALPSACVRVSPYQRETHAKTIMQDEHPLDAKLQAHVEEYREGAIGGSGVGGGGCGCN